MSAVSVNGSDINSEFNRRLISLWYHRAISSGKYSLHLNGTGDIWHWIRQAMLLLVGIGDNTASSYLYFAVAATRYA
jgi:hypothetical protein